MAPSARSPSSADEAEGAGAGRGECGFASRAVGYAHDIPREIDDTELVRAAQSGDRAALDQLLRRHYDRIHAVARRIAGSSRDADDACQEALIKIVRALPTFDGRAAFGTWAYRIATNAALDELRRRKRRPALHAVDDSDGSDRRGPAEPVDEMGHRRVDAVADRMAIDDALEELPDEFRAAVVLRDVLDLDYDEIAATLDVPIGTVKSRIARGRRLLVDRLGLDEARSGDTATTDAPADGAPTDDVTRDAGAVGNRAVDHGRPTDST